MNSAPSLAAAAEIDGYVIRETLATLVSNYRLVPDWRGNITLRATGMDLRVVERLAAGSVLAALDLAGSADAREQASGLRLLDGAIEQFRA